MSSGALYLQQLESYVKAREPDYSQPHLKTEDGKMGFHHNRNGEKVYWRMDDVKPEDFKQFIKDNA